MYDCCSSATKGMNRAFWVSLLLRSCHLAERKRRKTLLDGSELNVDTVIFNINFSSTGLAPLCASTRICIA